MDGAGRSERRSLGILRALACAMLGAMDQRARLIKAIGEASRNSTPQSG